MAINPKDLNSPVIYTPRNKPVVYTPDSRVTPASDPEAGSAYLYDEGELWDEPIENLPIHKPYAPPAAFAQAESDNPYAKRRAQVNHKEARHQKATAAAQRSGHPLVYAIVSGVCLVILVIIGVMMMPQMAGFFWKDLGNYAFINGEMLQYDSTLVSNYKQYRDYLKQDMIYQGVFIDGIHVGGMTMAEAETALNASGSSTVNAFSITINIGNKSWVIDNTNTSATRRLDGVLHKAYVQGRQNTTATIGTTLTPFRERVNTVTAMLENYVYLNSDATYDRESIRQKVSEIAAYVTREPIDSVIQTFDPNTRTFTFSDEQPGVTIDSEALYQQIIAKMDSGTRNESIDVTAQITTPAITKADMMNNFKMIAAYTTNTTSAKNRNTNIDLASRAISGRALMPGEVFSFNEATGQRTTDKGYQSAGAIASGQSIEEVGGGICQVSTTLFNAVARADLEMVSRSPHAWPVDYVNFGEDATVNWPNLDFQFKNNKSTPIFILTYYNDRKCSAEIWGMTLGTGVTIELKSRTIQTIDPPSDILYKQNTSLPPGTSKDTVKARTGYVVETYKVWYKDGQEYKSELLHTSKYRAYQKTVEYN